MPSRKPYLAFIPLCLLSGQKRGYRLGFGHDSKNQTMSNSKISAVDIRDGMRTVAEIIQLHGDAYWPIMERLQRELRALEGREKLLTDLLGNDVTVQLSDPN